MHSLDQNLHEAGDSAAAATETFELVTQQQALPPHAKASVPDDLSTRQPRGSTVSFASLPDSKSVSDSKSDNDSDNDSDSDNDTGLAPLSSLMKGSSGGLSPSNTLDTPSTSSVSSVSKASPQSTRRKSRRESMWFFDAMVNESAAEDLGSLTLDLVPLPRAMDCDAFDSADPFAPDMASCVPSVGMKYSGDTLAGTTAADSSIDGSDEDRCPTPKPSTGIAGDSLAALDFDLSQLSIEDKVPPSLGFPASAFAEITGIQESGHVAPDSAGCVNVAQQEKAEDVATPAASDSALAASSQAWATIEECSEKAPCKTTTISNTPAIPTPIVRHDLRPPEAMRFAAGIVRHANQQDLLGENRRVNSNVATRLIGGAGLGCSSLRRAPSLIPRPVHTAKPLLSTLMKTLHGKQ